MTDIHAVRMLEERDAELTALRAEIAAKDKLIHEMEATLNATEWAQLAVAAKDKEIALFKAVENHLPSTWAIGEDATAELALGLANRDKEIARLREALTIGRDLVGPWLSGALDDPETCEAMKGDISAFFEAIEGCTSASEDEKKERLGAVDTLINPPAGARPGAGDIPDTA